MIGIRAALRRELVTFLTAREAILGAALVAAAGALLLVGALGPLTRTQDQAWAEAATLARAALADDTSAQLVVASIEDCRRAVQERTTTVSECPGPPGLPPPSAFFVEPETSRDDVLPGILPVIAVVVSLAFGLIGAQGISRDWSEGTLAARLAVSGSPGAVLSLRALIPGAVAAATMVGVSGLIAIAVGLIRVVADPAGADPQPLSALLPLLVLVPAIVVIVCAVAAVTRRLLRALAVIACWVFVVDGFLTTNVDSSFARFGLQSAVVRVLRHPSEHAADPGGPVITPQLAQSLLVLVLTATVLVVAGVWSTRRRDLVSG